MSLNLSELECFLDDLTWFESQLFIYCVRISDPNGICTFNTELVALDINANKRAIQDGLISLCAKRILKLRKIESSRYFHFRIRL